MSDFGALTHSLNLPMPADFHVNMIKSIIPEIVKELKGAFELATGENPWE